MLRPTLLLLALTLLVGGRAAECPKQQTSAGREIVCYTTTLDAQLLSDSICRCTTIIHEGHDLTNLSISGVQEFQKSVKEANPFVQFVISVKDVSNTLRTSATVRQEAIARLTGVLNEVDGIELNVTAGSKERLFHFVKGLKDEIVRKSKDKRILMNLPAKPEILAKHFDIKELTKYVDLFTISTHYLTDADEGFKTFHPSRLMGLFDMLNTDSLVDLISGLGAPKRQILVTLPATSYNFTLKSEEETTPRSPTTEKEPTGINRKQLCEAISDGEWTVERDEDLTAPYAFKNKTWIAFEDNISLRIKGKYALLRDLAGIGIHDVKNDMKTDCGNSLTEELYESFANFKRKSRQAVLSALEDDLHQAQLSYPKHVKSSDFRIVRVVDTEGHIRAVRENTQTEFSCTRQGYFVHPRSCNRFYRCVKFNQEVENYSVFEFDCPAGLAFDERTEVCVWPHTLPEGSPCPGSSEIAPTNRARFHCPSQAGYYADKQNCRFFFACMDLGDSELTAYEFRCPFGLVFDEEKLVCEWPWLVPSCSGSGSGYTRTEYDNSAHGIKLYNQEAGQQQHTGGFGFSGPAGVDFSGYAGGNIGGSTGYSGLSTGNGYGVGSFSSGRSDSVEAGHITTEAKYDGLHSGATGVLYTGNVVNGHSASTEQYLGSVGGYGGSISTGSIGSFNKGYSGTASSGQSTLTSGSSTSTGLHSGAIGENYSGSINTFGSSTASRPLINGFSGSADTGYFTSSKDYSASTDGYFRNVADENFGSAGSRTTGAVGSIGSTGTYSNANGHGYTGSVNNYYGLGDTGSIISINEGLSTENGHSSLASGTGITGIYKETSDAGSSVGLSGIYKGTSDVGSSDGLTGIYKGTSEIASSGGLIGIYKGTTDVGSSDGLTGIYKETSNVGGSFGLTGIYKETSDVGNSGEVTGIYKGTSDVGSSGGLTGIYKGTSDVGSSDRLTGIYKETSDLGSSGGVTGIYKGTSDVGSSGGLTGIYKETSDVGSSGGVTGIYIGTSDVGSSDVKISQSHGSTDGSYIGVYGAHYTPTDTTSNSYSIVSGQPGSSTYSKSSEGAYSGQSAIDHSLAHFSTSVKTASDGGLDQQKYTVTTGSVGPGISIHPAGQATGSIFHNTGSFSGSQTGLANEKTTILPNSFSGSQMFDQGTHYGSTVSVLHPQVSTNYHGHSDITNYISKSGQDGYSTERNIYNTVQDGTNTGIYSTSGGIGNHLNVSLIGTDHLSSDNINIAGGIDSSTVYTHGSTGNYGLGRTEGHNLNTHDITGYVITGNNIESSTARDDSISGTVITHGGSTGTRFTEAVGHGTVVTEVNQPGQVNVNVGTDYVSLSTPAPGVFANGQTNTGNYLNTHTVSSGVSQGGFDQAGLTAVTGGFNQYASIPETTQYQENVGTSKFGSTVYSGFSETPQKSETLPGTVYQAQEYQHEKDIPDYRPLSPINPGIIVPGTIENTAGAYYNNTSIREEGQTVQTISSGNTAIHTQNAFTKTGPTKTGITIASLGGRGTYVISNGEPKPTLNYNNIGEKAFKGNVVGYTQSSNEYNTNTEDFLQVKSTLAPSVIGSSYTSDISNIDSSKITLGPSISSGYTYPKPSIPFASKTPIAPTENPLPPTVHNVFVTSTTPQPFLNIEVHNRPNVVSSTPATVVPAVVNIYDTDNHAETDLYKHGFESTKFNSQSIDSSSVYHRPTIYIDHRPSTMASPTTAYTREPLENYQTSIFNAAKLPTGTSTVQSIIDDGYKSVISSTIAPATFDSSRISHNSNTFQSGLPPSRPSPQYIVTKSGIPSSSTPQSIVPIVPEVSYKSVSTSAPLSPKYSYSTWKSTFGENVTPSTITYQQSTESGQPEILYLPSTTAAPAVGVTYRKGFTTPAVKCNEHPIIPPTLKQDVFKGYSYPKPTISTDASLYGNRGFTMTTLGSRITTGESPLEHVEKAVTNFGRGTAKYTTTGSYENSVIGQVPDTLGSFPGNEYGRKTYVSSTTTSIGRTPNPPVITTYSGGYSKIPITTPSYTTRKSTVQIGTGKVIVKWSDLHPLLLGKLGAECTCKADPFANLRGPGSRKLIASTKGQIDLSNYDESDVYVDLGNGESGEYHENLTPRVTTYRPATVEVNSRSQISIKSGPHENPSSTYLPAVSTVAPSSRYLPSVTSTESSLNHDNYFGGFGSSATGRIGKKLEDKESATNSVNGGDLSFDRYEPSGLRDNEETFEGVTECARPGLFRHPNYCNKFYVCHWDEWKKKFTLHVFNCPIHLTFDVSAGACNWPSKGPACQDGNLLV